MRAVIPVCLFTAVSQEPRTVLGLEWHGSNTQFLDEYMSKDCEVLEAEGSACTLAQRQERARDAEGRAGRVGSPGEGKGRRYWRMGRSQIFGRL